MKKIIKKEVMIVFIIGVILSSSIVVYATMTASDVDYKNGQKVSEALDDLYSRIPKGTIKITTKEEQKDVSSYQYADTTGLYTSIEYQDYGNARYLAGANSNGGIKIEKFVIKKGYNHYELGFNPSFVFYTNEDGQCWSFAGDSTLYIHTSDGCFSMANFFSIGNNGFYYNYDSSTDSKEVTLYAVK